MLQYQWEWDLKSSPTRLWPLVSDTNRFNRDAGLPAHATKEIISDTGEMAYSYSLFGWKLCWKEKPFDYVINRELGVLRQYLNGPIQSMQVRIELHSNQAGTKLKYSVQLRPRNQLWKPLLHLIVGIQSKKTFDKIFHWYDQLAQQNQVPQEYFAEQRFASGGKERLGLKVKNLQTLPNLSDDIQLAIKRLGEWLLEADDQMVGRIRPFSLARKWNLDKRSVLNACLHAVRQDLLDFRWDLLCPQCRGVQKSSQNLSGVVGELHCSSCRIDFDSQFDKNVEVTFRPNASIRPPAEASWCLGGPGVTPHIVFRKEIKESESFQCQFELQPGSYRIRSPYHAASRMLLISEKGTVSNTVELSEEFWAESKREQKLHWNSSLTLSIHNLSQQLDGLLIERTEWIDDAVTAAEITALQIFRDLFSEEALRPGEEISVGTQSFLFTDLRSSTQLYQKLGDAKGFGLVMMHFDLLKQAIDEEGGAIVKTIGDAVMAVFSNPLAALRAALKSNQLLGEKSDLILKSGIHSGPCIAVNQNGRLDYFGSTLNISARLLEYCKGSDVIMTQKAIDDPEVKRWIENEFASLKQDSLQASIRGLENEIFDLRRLYFSSELQSKENWTAVPMSSMEPS